jgi:hypothetical protein
MISDETAAELQVVFQTQHSILSKLDAELDRIEQRLDGVDERAETLANLEDELDFLEEQLDAFEYSDLADFDPDNIRQIYTRRRRKLRRELSSAGFEKDNWDAFVRQCASYNLANDLAMRRPFDAHLDEADRETLEAESYASQYRWETEDYYAVGIGGLLGAIVDYFVVGIPSSIHVGEFAGQEQGPLTGWLKNYDVTDDEQQDLFAQVANSLEERCKSPYDAMETADGERLAGMSPKTHRFQSLGHDPLLGFVFGVFDFLRGSVTGFEYSPSSGAHIPVSEVVEPDQQISLITAFLKHVGHLLSDVATPQGLPAPAMTALQWLNTGSIVINGQERTLAELARWMYVNGYDLRHFLASSSATAAVELVVRGYILITEYIENGEVELMVGGHPKYRSMLLAAHTVATAGNAGKIALYSGNPLAINQAEWMALFRYLLPSIKYWTFDRERLRLEYLEELNAEKWDELERANQKLWREIAEDELPRIELGVERTVAAERLSR